MVGFNEDEGLLITEFFLQVRSCFFLQFDESGVLVQAPHLYDVVRQLWPVLGPYSLLGVIIIRLLFNFLTVEAIAILLVQSN